MRGTPYKSAMNLFQILSIAIAIIVAVAAALVFGGILPGFRSGPGGASEMSVSLWGVLPQDLMARFLDEFKKEYKNFNIQYIQIPAENFELTLINALASGQGPDLWLIPQNLILKHKNKVAPISFRTFKERDFKDIFIDEAELYLDYNNQNIIALPFIIDPLVMFYNKDLLRNAGLTKVPETWDQFITTSQALTIKDAAGNIKQAGSALGEYSNVSHAQNIIAALILQTGNPIIAQRTFKVVLGEKQENILVPAESALRFYTEFSNPRKISYSWNKFLEPSKELFLQNKLVIYFSFASELKEIKEKNPHLNFDIAQFPQILDGGIKATFGRMWGIAVSNQSKNKEAAFKAGQALVSQNSLEALSGIFFLPPVRKDMLSRAVSDPYLAIFYKAAIWSRAWLEPDPEFTSAIFKNMIESVNKGEKNTGQAVLDAKNKLESIMK